MEEGNIIEKILMRLRTWMIRMGPHCNLLVILGYEEFEELIKAAYDRFEMYPIRRVEVDSLERKRIFGMEIIEAKEKNCFKVVLDEEDYYPNLKREE